MKKNAILFKVALLSISLVVAGGPAASSLIPLIHQSYPEQSSSAIELIATMPNFGILLFVLLGNLVLKYIGRRKTVLLGLSVALIGGITPVFIQNYYIILLSRFIFGVGIGMYNALAVSLITELYEGDEQASLMGFQSTTSFVGSTLMTLIVGSLTKFGWNLSFLAYLMVLLPLVLFALFVNIDENRFGNVDNKTKNSERVNLATLVMVLLAFLIFALFFIIMLKTATFLVETGIGQPEDAARVLSTITMVGIVIGVIYGKLFKFFKHWILPVGLIGMGIGFLIILNSQSVAMVTFGTIISGLFYSMAAPFLFMLVGKLAPENSINLSTSLYLIGVNMGVFLSPIVNNWISVISGASKAAQNFWINGLLLIVLGVVSFIVLAILNRAKPKLLAK